MSKQLDNETDEQYEQRMAKELDEFCSERGVGLVASIISVPITSPDGRQTFFGNVPQLELKKKRSPIIRPEVNKQVLDKAIKDTALKLV